MNINEPEIKPNILIVDDIEDNLFLLKEILKNLDVTLIMAGSGLEALSKIKDMEIALAILDIHMPVMDGVELAEKIQNDNSREKIPIIFITAYLKEETEQEKYYKAGAVDFIQKPFRKNILIYKVKVFMELYRQKQQIRVQKLKIENTTNELEKSIQLLKKRFTYEHLLSNISGMAVSMDKIDNFLGAVLSVMGKTLDLCWVNMFEHNYTTNTLSNSREWCIKGVSSHKGELQNLPASLFSNWTEIFKKHQIQNFSDVNDIQENEIKKILCLKNILSVLAIPLFIRDKYIGFICFSDCEKHRKWHDKDVEFLISICRIITSATERRLAEKELKDSLEQLHALSNHVEKVREEERETIARELHDDLGQALTAVKIDLGIIKKTVHDKDVKKRITKTAELVSNTIKTVRKVTFQLRPKIIDDLGLKAGIVWYTSEFSERNGIEIILDIDSDIVISSDVSLVVFRIMQESLTNIARHAEATQVTIQLFKKNNFINFVISDNGIGISESQLKSKTAFGIIGMKERAISVGGEINIFKTNKGGGTSIELIFPLPELENFKPI